MASRILRNVVDDLRRMALLSEAKNMTDAQLLEWYLEARDEAAFRALVRRHGPMVLGVCQGVLRHAQDAEDAFQATFMVLVQKAATLKCRQLLGNWLHGVAYRTAMHAKAAISKRRAKEQQMTNSAACEAVEDQTIMDLRPLLDKELDRLPEKYRTAIVLCELEGRPRAVVARDLGIPEGTLSSRLAAGRKILAQRLTRRGLTVSGAVLAATLSKTAAAASVPPSLVMATAKAGTLFAAGNTAGVLSVNVATLTAWVLNALWWAKLKVATGLVLVSIAGALALAVGAGLTGTGPARPKPEKGLGAPIARMDHNTKQDVRAGQVEQVASEPIVVDLWPAMAPGETGDWGEETMTKTKWNVLQVHNVSKPTLTIYRPAKEKDTGTVLIIAPGGTFGFLTWDQEGENIAQWCSSIGVTGIVLKYRVPRRDNTTQAAFQDGQRAVSLVRSRAAEWGSNPNRIGMIGFSAGAAVTRYVMLNTAQRSYGAVDDADQASTRLNYAALIYIKEGFGSKAGEASPNALNKDTLPPVFLCAASDDTVGEGAPASVRSYLALREAGVPVELHIYASGGNGFGIRAWNNPLVADWSNRLQAWMRYQKLLDRRD